MIHKDYGRIDYKPRLKKWRAIWYAGWFGERDVKLSDHNTKEDAIKELQDKIKQVNIT